MAITNLERLKIQLSKKQYYSDEEYKMFLEENRLKPLFEYDKEENEIALLETVIAILETLANDVDLMRKIDNKDIVSIDQASKYLSTRIEDINRKILTLKEEKEENPSNISFLFYNR